MRQKELNDALLLLCKRINPKDYEFHSRWHVWCNIGLNVKCLICGDIFNVNNINSHGIKHLKEYNLLSFI